MKLSTNKKVNIAAHSPSEIERINRINTSVRSRNIAVRIFKKEYLYYK
ncbi:hypothetical protein [Clostridium botulinum]|nr:hypothetical protein [Clostridium botulinum]MCR1146643.1 hypothetical protein [Clostridium botulinum]MCR1155526.1 hypothetical protein [Clostridium botulinum]